MRLIQGMTASLITMSIALLPLQVNAAAEAQFPKDWQKWTPVTTLLSQVGGLPGCDANVNSLPPIYQETVATYCALRPEGPGTARVLVKPDRLLTYTERKGEYSDGESIILHLQDLKVLFITGHQGGQPVYGVYTEKGQDITASTGPLSINTCITCHSGYTAFCIKGQCGRVID